MTTHGDYYNISCPHCGKVNHRVSLGVQVPYDKIIRITKLCPGCGKKIQYELYWVLKVRAEKVS